MCADKSMRTEGSGIIAITFLIAALLACTSDPSPEPTCDGTLKIQVVDTVDAQCGSAIGSLTVTGTGGATPYQYSLNQGASQASGTFTNLAPGFYTVKVVDQHHCEAHVDARIKSGVLLADIRPVIDANCAISGCHDGSSALPNFSDDDVLTNTADFVRGRTGNRSMPPDTAGLMLTNAEILLIACWAQDVVN
ncbi:MAG: SprB repeat-containing protein [Saprospiraceae bacterium]|nr:SprB repeat-containing protein [Saprospiraceae bacterium]